MAETVIKVQDLSKKYIIGHQGKDRYKTFREQMILHAQHLYSRTKQMLTGHQVVEGDEVEEFWALKDVSFEVRQGEILGIIGRNGAGKSTLLKILSRITEPTTGKVTLKGRIASLLEVGTGFHPELTGRENIFLNGAILGMSRMEIKRKFDEIVDFSGVEKFLDTPVKRYSSGMYVRLAFSVAAHLEPEILIVDEVLAVGDVEFQKKCLGRMQDVSQNDGRTVLFVSHDMQAISTLTNHSILLKNGAVVFSGPTKSVVNEYLNNSKERDQVYISDKSQRTPHIKRVEVQTSLPNNVHECMSPLLLEFMLYSPHPIKDACFSFQIIDAKGRSYVHQWLFDADMEYLREDGTFRLVCKIPSLKLYMGKYYLKCFFTESPGGSILEIIEDICPFEVVMFQLSRSKFQWHPETCAYIENAEWSVSKNN